MWYLHTHTHTHTHIYLLFICSQISLEKQENDVVYEGKISQKTPKLVHHKNSFLVAFVTHKSLKSCILFCFCVCFVLLKRS